MRILSSKLGSAATLLASSAAEQGEIERVKARDLRPINCRHGGGARTHLAGGRASEAGAGLVLNYFHHTGTHARKLDGAAIERAARS